MSGWQLVLVWDFVASSLRLKAEDQASRASRLSRTLHTVAVTFGVTSLLLSLLFVYSVGPSPEAAHLLANLCAAVLAVLVLGCGLYAALHVKRTLVGLRTAATRQQVRAVWCAPSTHTTHTPPPRPPSLEGTVPAITPRRCCPNTVSSPC
jgi:hypothetical protein